MRQQEKISDPMISQRVQEKLANMGIRAPCRVAVASNKGHVTLSGSIQYEHQRHTVLHAIRAVTGVQRVVDLMHVTPTGDHWKTNYSR
jgi:osmotically-inducible protein OsmY